jgi:hypothetical protein
VGKRAIKVFWMNGKKLEDYVTEQQWDMHWLDKESRRNK